jgi:hypothetical protein
LVFRANWWYVLLEIPLFLLMVLQYQLWEHASDKMDVCSGANKRLSFCILLVVNALVIVFPAWSRSSHAKSQTLPREDAAQASTEAEADSAMHKRQGAARESETREGEDHLLQELNPEEDSSKAEKERRSLEQIMTFLMILGVLWCIGTVSYTLVGYWIGWYPSCTYVGQWGMQVWPMIVPRLPNFVTSIGGKWMNYPFQWFTYGSLAGSVGLSVYGFKGPYPQAWLVRSAAACLGPYTFLPCYLILRAEAGQLWSWAATIISLAMVAEPAATRWAEKTWLADWICSPTVKRPNSAKKVSAKAPIGL